MNIRRDVICALMLLVAVGTVQARKLISWNIQNGMWSDQANNYDNFVEFLKTPYIDVIAAKHPGEFIQSSQNGRRIDYIYATEPVIKQIRSAEILNSGYTEQHREQGAQYWVPSDHRPILIEF